MTTTTISDRDGNATRRGLAAALLLLAVLALAGCLPAENNDGFVAVPEISGTYMDQFAGTHVIGEDTWDDGFSLFHYVKVRNGLDYLIAQNDAGNAFNAELFSRFNWTWDGANDLYYCQNPFNAASAADAEANSTADPDDLSAGCGGFGWSKLTPK